MRKVPGYTSKYRGFTIIELLMVMLLSSLLSSLALTAFLDFRKEARASVVKENLTTIRAGIRNQALQVRLKCGVNPDTWQGGPTTGSFYSYLFEYAVPYNDITHGTYGFPVQTFDPPCTTAQVPDPQDRKLWNVSSAKIANIVLFGTNFGAFSQGGEVVPGGFPQNDFIGQGAFEKEYPALSVTPAWLDLYGGACNLSDALLSGLDEHYHWFVDATNGNVYAGTNTPGIQECNY